MYSGTTPHPLLSGVDDDQLPEQMLMAAKFCKPDRAQVPWFAAQEAEAVPELLVDTPDNADNDNERCAGFWC